MIDMFNAGFHRLASALVAREKMQHVITSNIANADTPNYQADQRTFESFLQAHSDGIQAHAAVTNSKHFSDFSSEGSVSRSDIFHHHQARRMDGNNVDLQQEMARLSENQLMHELSMQLLKTRMNGLKSAIREGK